MSKNKPLLSDTEIRSRALAYVSPYDREVQRTANWVREIYEAQLSKDRELIQRMVNDMQDFVDKCDRGEAKSKRSYAAFKRDIALAGEHGHKPTEK